MRTRPLALIVIALIALPISASVVALVYFVSPAKIDLRIENVEQLDSRAQAAIEQAERTIPPAVLPSPPQAQTQQIERTEYKTIRVGPIRTKVPHVVTETRIVAPSTPAMDAWNADVQRLQAERAAKVEKEAERILTEQDRVARREEAKFWVAILAPIASTTIALITLALTVRRDRNAEARQPAEDSSRKLQASSPPSQLAAEEYDHNG